MYIDGVTSSKVSARRAVYPLKLTDQFSGQMLLRPISKQRFV